MSEEVILIKTVKDIVDKVPEEDIDNFLEDLRKRTLMHKGMKIFGGLVINDDMQFKWINDGKHEAQVDIEIIKE